MIVKWVTFNEKLRPARPPSHGRSVDLGPFRILSTNIAEWQVTAMGRLGGLSVSKRSNSSAARSAGPRGHTLAARRADRPDPGGSHGRRAQGASQGWPSLKSVQTAHRALTDLSTAAGSGASGSAGRRHFASSKQRQDDLRRACSRWARQIARRILVFGRSQGSKP
jgi:hypothetical protein